MSVKSPEDIIKKPYVTEKSNSQMAEGKYTFVVDTRSTKTEIKHAAEKLFGVKVEKVTTMNFEGKKKRVGVHAGRKAKWKKAIVKIYLDPKSESYLLKGGKQTSINKKYKSSIEEAGATQ